MIARGYIQRCNKYPVINFLSWTSPQGGQFGGLSGIFPNWLVVLFNNQPYDPTVQNTLSLAQYWRDPYDLESYFKESTFLADLNNERLVKNETYKENIKSLKTMLLIYSEVDYVVTPKQSGWFSTFQPFTGPGENGVIISMKETLLYRLDYIGLRVCYPCLHEISLLSRTKPVVTHNINLLFVFLLVLI